VLRAIWRISSSETWMPTGGIRVEQNPLDELVGDLVLELLLVLATQAARAPAADSSIAFWSAA